MNPTLALHGGPKAVTAPRPERHRWGAEELSRLTAMVGQKSLFYANGPQCADLAAEFRQTCPAKWLMPTSSGTAALHVAVAALQLPPGSEIITSPITDMGSVIGILYQQLVPVFADIHPHTYNLDPQDVRRRITSKTRAIMPVHLTGNPSDMEAIMTIAREHDLFVIEDCAQAWGALYRGKPVGSWGHLACFSFNEFKHVSCGDGGIVMTNDERFGPTLAKWADKFYDRNSAADARNPTSLAPNYRMSEPQAAVAAGQLTKLPAIIADHVRLGSRLLAQLETRALPGVSLPAIDPRDRHSFWFCLLRLDLARFRCTRDEFAAALVAEGAAATPGYIPRPVYRYPLFQNHDFFAGFWPLREAGLTTMDYRRVSCPVTEAVLADSISLAINPGLTDEIMDQTAAAVAKVTHHFAR
ncbi:glutamine--scyllo-inositol aminotransferase [Oleiharenicola lentus]|jgi:dTDP-4-amino-4,6-dideoxygalactose transaminase|uniref:Glutamine--scyllo-inositol aminotransferase n=1 Tax=Oleiharenicola lentus TaxID=2508720 RepID=A0A4Q1CB09_9BACT|nr:DegT/DnrJ/EryC1/StrS family aminotransferase [Oleiharenicola lentus]RXK56244.1 glutamine--scyllo-inositol aminotransferase [Oleiharenicola lentus]